MWTSHGREQNYGMSRMWTLRTFALLTLWSAVRGLECICPKIYSPVCGVDGKEYGNRCMATCEKVLIAYPGQCKNECSHCSSTWSPVCDVSLTSDADSRTTYASTCFAECNGAYDTSPGSCPRGCACLNVFAPVCGADGNTYSSESCAACNEVPALYEGPCKPDCNHCEGHFEVVCGSDGNSYHSPCHAECHKITDYNVGACGSDTEPCKKCESMPNVWAPMCVTRPKFIGRKNIPDGESVQSLTYSTPCYAQCAGHVPSKKAVHYPGECDLSCDMKCAKKGMNPVCCNGREYSNSCYAECAGHDCGEDCYSGQCKGEDAKILFENLPCAIGGPAVRCFADPCEVNVCKAHPDAKCFSNYCTRFFRFEYLSAGCDAYFLDHCHGSLLKC